MNFEQKPYTGKTKKTAPTKEQDLEKLKHFCGYQERCHAEVKEKLYKLKVQKIYHDEIIASLIEAGYLNEERFAIQYAGGKFRMKQWGRKKIIMRLKERQVSDYCIKKALKEINEEYYNNVLEKLARKKYQLLKSDQYLVRKKKTIDYLLLKGFEAELVLAAVQSIISK